MIAQLRDYQRETMDSIDRWFTVNTGNPCVEAPTASGKSWIIAGYVHRALTLYPSTRIIILAPQRELIEQDREKLLRIWPEAPVATYCAALKVKETGRPITIATIQSVYRKASSFGHIDLVLIDEAHLINTEDTGIYRRFIGDLTQVNPVLKCIGFTATPFRMRHGLITDQPSLFSAPLIKTRSIQWLQDKGYLCRLSGKHPKTELDVSKVSKDRFGEFRKDELQDAVDINNVNLQVARQILEFGKDRHTWVLFCSGIRHAQHMAEILRDMRISCGTVTGETPADERESILSDLKAGRLRAVTNNNVLTTGFDAPNIDLIALLRPTMSPGLFVQMIGRGLRTDVSKTNTLILDFAGNIMRHGGIYDIEPPKKKTEKGITPFKICPKCQEYVPLNARNCPECDFEFPASEDSHKELSEADPETGEVILSVRFWSWSVELSKKGSIPMIVCRYYGWNVRDPVLRRYYCVRHEGWAGQRAMEDLLWLCHKVQVNPQEHLTLADMCKALNASRNWPEKVSYKTGKRFNEIRKLIWRD